MKEAVLRLRRRDVALGGAGFVGAFLLTLFWPSAPRVQQPIQYNHQKHLDAGLDCATCHTLYATSPWAGLPTTETCSTCHQAPLTESPEEGKLVQLVEKGEALHWKQVNQLPTHVYFSHQTHAVSAGIDCATCHGEMQERTTPPTKPFFAWTMNACLNCHEQQRASLDCNGCHR
ncbi:MAG: cytochrome c3 family protein [Acidobacteria bacterium]|nr:cytochrome c3 family protein [Acidobacteriota bacterium]